MPRPRKQRFSEDAEEPKTQEQTTNTNAESNNPADHVNNNGPIEQKPEDKKGDTTDDKSNIKDDGDEVDLETLLNKPTEKKDFKANAEEKINAEDFDDDLPKNQIQNPNPTNQEEPKELTYYESAKLLLGTIEGIMNLLLPIGYKHKMFTAQERKRINELRYVKDKDYSVEDEHLFVKAKELDALIKAIPFNKEERKTWIVPAAATLEKYGWKPGPELSLIFATALLMIPRLTPLKDD